MNSFEIRNPEFRKDIERLFERAPFIKMLAITPTAIGPGWVESEIVLDGQRHTQQDGFAHAGVQATLADHTAGAAAATLVAVGQRVLTIEFKINLLRPALGDKLTCRADVLRAGRSIAVVEATVYALQAQSSRLTAKAIVTLAIIAADAA